MKKWTVMLIPNDRGERRTFEVHGWQILAAVVLVAGGAVSIAMYLHEPAVAHGAVNTAVDRAFVAPPPPEILPEPPVAVVKREPAPTPSVNPTRAAVEASVRAEYEARDSAIASELNRLYVFEAEVRDAMGMPPRELATSLPTSQEGGKGGGRPEAPEFDMSSFRPEFAPPHLIHGVDSPSADLMLQEMRIRMASMNELLDGMEVQRDRLARIPSIMPTPISKRTITSGFGNRRDPFTKRVRFHNGLDVATNYGSPIQATARGVVVESERDPYYGHYVKIDHGNGFETLFGHMSKRQAGVGQEIERGDIIGRVGSTGRSTAAHIHYEVIKDGKRVNPRKYLGQ